MRRTIQRTLLSAIFLGGCLLVGGKLRGPDFDFEDGFQATLLGAFVLVLIWGIVELVNIVRWRLNGGEFQQRRRRRRRI
jgi:hypothetical protein